MYLIAAVENSGVKLKNEGDVPNPMQGSYITERAFGETPKHPR